MLDRLKRADHIEGMIFKRELAPRCGTGNARRRRRRAASRFPRSARPRRCPPPIPRPSGAAKSCRILRRWPRPAHAWPATYGARHRVTIQMDGRFHRAVLFLPAEIQPFNHFSHKLFLSVRRAPARIRYVLELNFIQCAINS